MHTNEEKDAAFKSAAQKQGWPISALAGTSEGNLAENMFYAGYDLAATPAPLADAELAREDPATHCLSCDYANLTTDFGTKCPECGSQELEQWFFEQHAEAEEPQNLLRRAAAALPGPYAIHILGNRTRWLMTGGGKNVLRKLLSEYELNELTPKAAQLHRATDAYLAIAANALPGLLARLAAAEAKVASYLPAPLPTGWVLLGEQEPEEGLRCEVELKHHGEGEPPLLATYWAGREGDFAIWTGPKGEWYHDYQVVRYRYAPAETVKGGQPSC